MRSRLAICFCLLLGSCIAPARDASDYRYKASLALDEAHSALEVTRLAAGLLDEKELQEPPIEVLVREAGATISGSLGQLQLVKPPDEDSKQLRDEVGGLLEQAAGMVDEARLALQKGKPQEAVDALRGAGALSAELESRSKELGG